MNGNTVQDLGLIYLTFYSLLMLFVLMSDFLLDNHNSLQTQNPY